MEPSKLHTEHGQWRMVDDVLGETAVHHMEEPGPAVGGHGNEVRIDALGEALAEDDERGQEILGALYEYAEQIAPPPP